MNKCRLHGEFEYIKYTGGNKLDIYNVLQKYNYTRLDMSNHADWILYAKFNNAIKSFDTKVEIIFPGDYLVLLDENTLGHYDESIFNQTFYDVNEKEE